MDRGGWHYPPDGVRVSDADRDQAISELGAAFRAGRLTADEFDERASQTLRSRTGKELIALLADLPVERAALATRTTRTTAMDPVRRAVAVRVSAVAAVASVCFATAAAVAALSTGPSLSQEESTGVSHGLAPPLVFPSSWPGVDWAGTLTPAAIAVLLVMLVVFLQVRLARTERRPTAD